MQGGLDWELIAMIAAGASAAVIGWDLFASRDGSRSETRKGLLEIAWPILFIALMGLLLKFTDFAAVLLLAAVITGLIWLFDARFARPKRSAGEAEPVVVDMARAFFPVIVVVFLIRSFWVEPFKIPSGSMKPTLLVGDFILVNKYTYGIRLPVVNKKIVDINPIAPGDVVEFRNKRLAINGEPVPVQASGFYTDAEVNYTRLPQFLEKLNSHAHR